MYNIIINTEEKKKEFINTFASIKNKVDEAIMKIKNDPFKNTSISNYADIFCMDVEFFISSNLDSKYRVYINEIDCFDCDIINYIKEYVKADLNIDVTVKSEW